MPNASERAQLLKDIDSSFFKLYFEYEMEITESEKKKKLKKN